MKQQVCLHAHQKKNTDLECCVGPPLIAFPRELFAKLELNLDAIQHLSGSAINIGTHNLFCSKEKTIVRCHSCLLYESIDLET